MTKDDFRKFVEDKAKESVSNEPFDWQKEKELECAPSAVDLVREF